MADVVDEPWQVSQIVYTSIMGVVMCAALLEWFLWLVIYLPLAVVLVRGRADRFKGRFPILPNQGLPKG